MSYFFEFAQWFFMNMLVLCLFIWLWLKFWQYVIPLPKPPMESYECITEDGWQIGLHRWLPNPEVPARGYPVLMCHGICANGYNFHIDEEHSMALYLQAQGFDCWVLELRSANSKLVKAPKGTRRHNFCFDDLVDYDLPAAIRTVQAHTQSQQVHWIGHSMGGMIAYASDMGEPSALSHPIRSLTAIASPGNFSKEHKLAIALYDIFCFFPKIPSAFLSKLVAPIAPWFDWLSPWTFRPGSTKKEVIRFACTHLVSDLSTRLFKQFVFFIVRGQLVREDGDSIYEERLKQQPFPAFFMAGSHDIIAPPNSVYYAYRRWSGPKKWQLYEPDEGYQEYAHADLMIARYAPTEIYPDILQWLEQNDQPSDT